MISRVYDFFFLIVILLVLPMTAFANMDDVLGFTVGITSEITIRASVEVSSPLSTDATSNSNSSDRSAPLKQSTERFIFQNYTSLSEESAQGFGKHISTLYQLWNCEENERDEFAKLLQENYYFLFARKKGFWKSRRNLVRYIQFFINRHPKLSAVCPLSETQIDFWVAVIQEDDVLMFEELANDLDIKNQRYLGMSAFLYATSQNSLQIAQKLVQLGEDIEQQDSEGNTALHLSAQYKHSQILKWLIAKGLQTDIKNKLGYTAKEVAKLYHHREIIEILEQYE